MARSLTHAPTAVRPAGADVADRPLLVAAVRGAYAAALVPVADDRLAVVEAAYAAGRVSESDVAEARESAAAVLAAGRQWAMWVTGGGNAEAVAAETPAPLRGEIGTDAAADMLGVTPRRVRQLLAAGDLAGRRVGPMWIVDRASVQAYKSVRSVSGGWV